MAQLPTPALAFTAGLLFIAVVTDVQSRRVHNLVTLPLMISGMLYHAAQTGIPGLLQSVAAVVLAVSLLFVPCLLGGMGAGDMKLLAGIGAWALLPDLIWIFSIAGLLAGVWSLVMSLRRRRANTGTFARQLLLACRIRQVGRALDEGSWATRSLTEGHPRLHLIPFALLLAVGIVTRFCMTH
jgi:Flp pilus assembly protein protease CpaA